jgi:hypothetical protein
MLVRDDLVVFKYPALFLPGFSTVVFGGTVGEGVVEFSAAVIILGVLGGLVTSICGNPILCSSLLAAQHCFLYLFFVAVLYY